MDQNNLLPVDDSHFTIIKGRGMEKKIGGTSERTGKGKLLERYEW